MGSAGETSLGCDLKLSISKTPFIALCQEQEKVTGNRARVNNQAKEYLRLSEFRFSCMLEEHLLCPY